MLITELKNKEVLNSTLQGKKVFVLTCHGCKEIYFPEHEADAFIKELADAGMVTGSLTTDYICNADNLKLRLQKHAELSSANADALTRLSMR